MARVAAKIDCTACDTTGYANFYRTVTASGYYRPGPMRRWDKTEGQLVYAGSSSIKMDAKYESLLNRATHIRFNGTDWNFSMMRDPGAAMGQHRLILALTRKE